ncbi:hypothetical protein GH5_04075 [Leishmania sp. Ghana 2012 LV757]|uniref:hypothetical protein n=1 Tax=Leishmania sp. Ghana 2012 LV757 TaxID=2803181 RepID=UPI001B5BF5A9|nr:hypothetical protein GH5_04075 [Leishmania sp. Ghana 2012 LV757]
MAASRARRGGAAVEEVEMTQNSNSSPLLRGDDSVASATLLTDGATMSAVAGHGADESIDGIHIRVWYLDDGATQAAWHLVPNVSTLRQMLRGQDGHRVMPTSPPSAGDHFAKLPSPLYACTPTTTSAARSLPSRSTVDKAYDKTVFSPIMLSATSPSSGDARPAWVSIKAATEEELREVLESLPVHVLTRRRIISVLCTDTGAEEPGTPQCSESDESSSDTEGTEPSSGGRSEKGGRVRRHVAVRDNFLEYFPAHGYAVLCLQAMELQGPESTGRGTIQRDGTNPLAAQLPCTPVVVLAFESTLFTFSVGYFGGEEDVHLIMANHTWFTGSPAVADEAGARETHAAASHATSHVPSIGSHKQTESMKTTVSDARADGRVDRYDRTLSLHHASGAAKDGCIEAATEVPLAHHAAAAALDLPSSLSAQQLGEAQQPMMPIGSPNGPTSPNSRVTTAISIVCSSLVSAIIAYLQQSTRARLIEADQLDELVLQILPSRVDQDDLLLRTKNLRHRIAFVHVDALQKERVLKELLLPAMRLTPLSRSAQAVERYHRSLSSIRSTVLHLRKGRDIVNRASMTLISGVSARLLSHCNFMDYLNHVQTQIAVILMPITIIPNLFAMNVRVPFTDAATMTPFFCIVGITLGILVLSVAPIVYKFLMYKTPGALAPLD